MKKLEHLNLREWQNYLDRFSKEADKVKSPTLPIAMRIENTQLTIARYYGGIKYNGTEYTYFEPEIPEHAPNPDGSPYVAWLIVRNDFLKWVKAEIRKENTLATKAKAKKEEQTTLF